MLRQKAETRRYVKSPREKVKRSEIQVLKSQCRRDEQAKSYAGTCSFSLTNSTGMQEIVAFFVCNHWRSSQLRYLTISHFWLCSFVHIFVPHYSESKADTPIDAEQEIRRLTRADRTEAVVDKRNSYRHDRRPPVRSPLSPSFHPTIHLPCLT